MRLLATHAPTWLDASTAGGALTASAIVLAVALLAYLVGRRYLVRALTHLSDRTDVTWDDVVVRRGVPSRLALLLPIAAIYAAVLALPHVPAAITTAVERTMLAAAVVVVIGAFNAAMTAVNDLYELFAPSSGRTIKGYVQVGKLVATMVGVVVALAALLDRSPLLLLGGLGAATAVLLLIFRDTILSLVASVQLATNDMVRVGDWIEVPQFGADGDVIDIALHTVKVQNWDKTITTIPTYKLIDESFRNWRGMIESGGRRIKRAINLDVASVRFLTPDDIARLRGYQLLTTYLDDKLENLGYLPANLEEYDSGAALVGGAQRLTNLGTFRAYVEAYLGAHPGLHQEGMTFMVRQLAPGPEGVPLEVYVFTKETSWPAHEAVQADLFDHLLSTLQAFDLRPFQHPTGAQFEALALARGR